jgi:hypothetical protein
MLKVNLFNVPLCLRKCFFHFLFFSLNKCKPPMQLFSSSFKDRHYFFYFFYWCLEFFNISLHLQNEQNLIVKSFRLFLPSEHRISYHAESCCKLICLIWGSIWVFFLLKLESFFLLLFTSTSSNVYVSSCA